jgi:hypothetical protein
MKSQINRIVLLYDFTEIYDRLLSVIFSTWITNYESYVCINLNRVALNHRETEGKEAVWRRQKGNKCWLWIGCS